MPSTEGHAIRNSSFSGFITDLFEFILDLLS